MPVVLEPSWVGRRVSVRRAVGPSDGQPRYSDVVGELVSLDPATAVVDTRTGPVEVPLASVAAARIAPPSTADELALEAVVARGWRPAHTAELGGWLLRANGGFTHRANSVLPLRPPGMPLGDAIATARAWYADRGLPLLLQLPAEARRLLDAELGERGWAPSDDVHVMVARLDTLRDLPPAGPAVVGDVLDDGWLGVYRTGTAVHDDARGLLRRHDTVGFAAVREGGRTLAVGRGTVDDGWLGITAVEVLPDHRGRGLARAVMGALVSWGHERGATHSHLEVSADNRAGVLLYERLGWWRHHDYRYRTDPGPEGEREPGWLG